MMPLCHFDIPAKNIATVKQFYQGVFGWTFEKEEGSSESWSISFGANSHGQPGTLTGALVPRSAPTQPIGCYFLVTSIDETSVKIQELGGVVFVSKTAVPGKGFYACCLDPEDSYFIIWEREKKDE